jgi:hypothetical protein
MTTIGVFSVMPLPGFSGRFAVYARALARAGATVHRIICDGAQSRCATDTFLQALPNRFGHCPTCAQANHWISTFGNTDDQGSIGLSSLVDGERQQAALAAIAGLADGDLESWSWQGHPCGAWLDEAMRSDTNRLHWREQPDWPAAARGWLGTMVTGILAAEGYIRRYQPDALLLPNGRLAAERGIRSVAAAHGLPVYTEDTGLRPGTFTIRRNSAACDFDFSPEWAQWSDVPLTAAEEARLDDLLRAWQQSDTSKAVVFSPVATGDLDAFRRRLDLDRERPVVAVFTGVLDDTNLYSADTVFRDQTAWLDTVVTIAAQRPDWQVVLRLHPIDAATHIRRAGRFVSSPERLYDRLRLTWPVLPANVRIIPSDSPLSSHDLLAIAAVVVTYVSTVGMEATLKGLPTVVCGSSHYAHTGLAWMPQRPDDLQPLIERLVAQPEQPDEAVTKARRYIYLAHVRCMYDFAFLTSEERSWDLSTELRALAGHVDAGDGDLPRFCQALTGQRALVDPPPGKPPLLPSPITRGASEPISFRPPGRLTIAVAVPDGNGFAVDWPALTALADDLLVISGPQRRTPAGLPAGARLITAPSGDLNACWQQALAATDAAWILLLTAGETLIATPAALQAVTRKQPLTPTIGLVTMRGGDVPVGAWLEPRLLSRAGDWRIRGTAFPTVTSEAEGRQLGGRTFLLPEVTLRSRTTQPAAVAARRTLTWLRAGLEQRPDSQAWHEAAATVLAPLHPPAAARHQATATGQPSAVKLTVAVAVTADAPLSRLHLAALDGLAEEVLVLAPAGLPLPDGPPRSVGGRNVTVADATPKSLEAAARQAATGDWLLLIYADEMIAPGSAEALALWVKTIGRRQPGAQIACQAWPQAGQPASARLETRLWRHDAAGATATPWPTVPGMALWARPQGPLAPPPAMTATPAPTPAALIAAAFQLMQGNLPVARAELLTWRQAAAEDDPDRFICDEWLVTTALALGDWPLALTVAERVLASRCDRPVLAFQAATALHLAGDLTGAARACLLAVAARQTWNQGPADLAWQPEMLMTSLLLAMDGPEVAAHWLGITAAEGPLAVMKALLGILTGEAAGAALPGVPELAAELMAGGWLAHDATSAISHDKSEH